ncbi:hypothetical protein MRX96_058259 [Rhipicephalus microplus]
MHLLGTPAVPSVPAGRGRDSGARCPRRPGRRYAPPFSRRALAIRLARRSFRLKGARSGAAVKPQLSLSCVYIRLRNSAEVPKHLLLTTPLARARYTKLGTSPCTWDDRVCFDLVPSA